MILFRVCIVHTICEIVRKESGHEHFRTGKLGFFHVVSNAKNMHLCKSEKRVPKVLIDFAGNNAN